MAEQDLYDVILFQIERTNKKAKQYSQKEFDRLNLNLTVDQWVLLKIIQRHQPLSQTLLAEKSIRDPASITRTLDLLAKAGYIERKTIAGNRRQYNISLTAKGQKFLGMHMEMVKQHRQQSVQGFSDDELKLLQQMLLRIQENMS